MGFSRTSRKAECAKRCDICYCPDGKQHPSNWKILDGSHWLLPIIGSDGNNSSLLNDRFCGTCSRNYAFPIPPHTQHHLLRMLTDFRSSSRWFISFHVPFRTTLLQTINFPSTVRVLFKNGSQMEICCPLIFTVNREATKHRSDSRIQVFSNVLKRRAYETCGLSLWCCVKWIIFNQRFDMVDHH